MTKSNNVFAKKMKHLPPFNLTYVLFLSAICLKLKSYIVITNPIEDETQNYSDDNIGSVARHDDIAACLYRQRYHDL